MALAEVQDTLNITRFRALWWDLPSPPKIESVIKRVMNGDTVVDLTTTFAHHGCAGFNTTLDELLYHAVLGYEVFCPACKAKFVPSVDSVIEHVGDGHIPTLARLYALKAFISNWRSRWFDDSVGGYAYFDQLSVRIVSVDHAAKVQEHLRKAVQQFCSAVPLLDEYGILREYFEEDAPIWKQAIRFPEFVAEDVDAKRLVYETVAHSISGSLQEMHDAVLKALASNGEVGKRAKSTLQKRLADLRDRDMWGVTQQDPKVRELIDGLEGMLE